MVMCPDGKWSGASLVCEPPGGWPRYGYTRQLPEGISVPLVTDISTHLPGALALDGWQLLKVKEFVQYRSADPFVLYNPWGEIVAQWETRPSLGTLMEYVPRVEFPENPAGRRG